MTTPRAVIPMRATMLMDAPEGAVRRALARTDVWTRTARAAGARADVAAPASLSPSKGPRSPLRTGELIRVRSDSGKSGTGSATGAPAAGRGRLWPARSLIFRVTADQESEDSARAGPRLPVLELLAGPLKFCRISLVTASTGAGTLVTVDCRASASPTVLTPLLRRRILRTAQLLLGVAMLAAREIRVVVAGAVVADTEAAESVVLAARRTSPPELAGRWELPGGKVEPGETERAALTRELAEELQIQVRVGERIGPDVDLGDNAVLRCYLAEITAGRPEPREHDDLRWVAVAELAAVDWLPADRELLDDLRGAMLTDFDW